jgi:hypothetical protein
MKCMGMRAFHGPRLRFERFGAIERGQSRLMDATPPPNQPSIRDTELNPLSQPCPQDISPALPLRHLANRTPWQLPVRSAGASLRLPQFLIAHSLISSALTSATDGTPTTADHSQFRAEKARLPDCWDKGCEPGVRLILHQPPRFYPCQPVPVTSHSSPAE